MKFIARLEAASTAVLGESSQLRHRQQVDIVSEESAENRSRVPIGHQHQTQQKRAEVTSGLQREHHDGGCRERRGGRRLIDG